MFKVLKHMRKSEWEMFLFSLILVITQIWLDLKLPDYMNTITKLVKTEGSAISEIIQNGKMMLLCAVLGLFISVLTRYLSSKLASSFSMNLREKIFSRVQSYSMEEFERFSTASLITRSTNDVQQVQNFIARGLRMIVRTPILAIWAIIKIMNKDWRWSLLTTVSVLVVLSTVVIIIIYARPRFRRRQILTDELNRTMRENLTGIRVVRAYNAEKYQEEKFEDANNNLTQNMLEARRVMGLIQPITRLNHNMLNVGIYCIGAYLIANANQMNQLDLFSDMVVFSNYASKILMAFMSLDMIFAELPRVNISIDRINEVLDTEPAIHDGAYVNKDNKSAGSVEFRNVSFHYPDSHKNVIENISFTVNPRETVAIIGATGSGKSTLIRLIPRFFDATEGEVLVNGINVREYQQESLHNLIGYASQRAVLFSGTVTDNIDYGKNNREENDPLDVKKACDIAEASSFIEKMENQYDAVIQRGGVNVSGGQKQRLSIARTVYRKPQIYIYDDTFSALDYQTDKTLRENLKRETADVTTIIVAQRIGTIRDADKIIVLDEGKIVGEGTHQQLLENCNVYKEIAKTQLSEEELA